MELTREYFDKHMELTKEYFDKRLEAKLDQHTKDLRNYIRNQNTELVAIIQETVVKPTEKRFQKVETKLAKNVQKTIRHDKAI
jgi:hypothetical protein